MGGKKRSTKVQVARMKQLENRQWLDENFSKIQEKYSDLWVVVADKEVKAHGPDVKQVKNDVGDKLEEAVVMRIPKDKPIKII